MKKNLLILICLGLFLTGFAQQHRLTGPAKVNPAIKNIALTKSINPIADVGFIDQSAPALAGPRAITENEIGTTMYDLQTNAAIDHRIRLHPDGSVGAAWTYGTPPYSNRGTGYNFKNASGNWGPAPTARLEGTIRTGWGTYAQLGANGEIVAAHGSPTAKFGLYISQRPVRGTGAWTTTFLAPPSTPENIEYVWPRIMYNNGVIHILCHTGNDNLPFQGVDKAILYLRSEDNGATWSEPIVIPGLYGTGYQRSGGDSYAWAEPVGNTIAFVTADSWADITLMKSNDNGVTWTKTTVFEHPSPWPMFQTPPVASDTIYVCDGAIAVDLDPHGNAHIAFGVYRVLYSDPTTDASSWYPATGYVAYWNESYPPLTSLEPEEMWNAGLYIGSVLDLDNSGSILDNLTDISEIASYFVAMASFPTITVDDNGMIWVVYSALNELEYGGSMSYSQFFRNLYLTYSYDGVNWPGIYFLTDPQQDIMYEGMECIFPALSKTSDHSLHMIFQRDDEPGLSIRGDEDPATVNDIVYMAMPKIDFTSGNFKPQTEVLNNNILSVYPNPASTLATVMVKSERNQTANILVTNILGQVVINETQNVVAGNNTLNLNVENLASGPYMIKVNVGNRSESQILMIN